MSGLASLRVWLAEDPSGLLSARLVPRAPSHVSFQVAAISEEEALAELSSVLVRALELDPQALDDFQWTEELRVDQVRVEVRPQSLLGKRSVIGKEPIPVTFTYAYAELGDRRRPEDGGGFVVIVPRFGWSFVLEDLGMAAEVLRQALAADLVGASARSVFDFREVKSERVLDWRPKRISQKQGEPDPLAGHYDTVRQVAEDFTELARAGKLPPHYGEHDAASLARAQSSADGPSILLVGPAGVGKTAWVRELARRLPRGASALESRRVFATSADRILAGMQYLGMWEERCLALVAELAGDGHFLYVDHLLPLTRPRSNASSIADLFLPALESGDVRLIAEATPAELAELKVRAPTLLSVFQLVELDPPSPRELVALLAERARRSPRAVRFDAEATRRLLRHLTLFRKDHAFPGKALAFHDWLDRERDTQAPATLALTLRDADRAFCRWSGLPEPIVSDDERTDTESLARRLSEHVIGQEAACHAAARVLTRFKAQIQDPEKPVGTLLFVGPTGVGKTELAKALANFLFGSRERMIRLDMSEYLAPGAAHRLLSDERGSDSLVQRVGREPLSLVLLDEIEKAHPAVFDVLLSALGEGHLTSASGRRIDLSMALIVMTSNLGTDTVHVGFGAKTADRDDARSAVLAHFRPEFINRLDEIVAFSPLTPAALGRIVDLELTRAASREGLVRRKLTLRIEPALRERLLELGYHPKYGARPLKRVIEEHVVTPVAIELARRPRLENARLRLALAGTEVRLSVE
ncbi:MAG: AAA family ATPase [Polyangiaceae bacterium]